MGTEKRHTVEVLTLRATLPSMLWGSTDSSQPGVISGLFRYGIRNCFDSPRIRFQRGRVVRPSLWVKYVDTGVEHPKALDHT
jgi:hypothetical protein